MRKNKIGLLVNVLFAQLLKFIIPLLILGLVTPEMGADTILTDSYQLVVDATGLK